MELGGQGSEQAHQLSATPSSGTNAEAERIRRYACHLSDFSGFEFDMKVQVGMAFVLRQSDHTTGVGTESFESVVDAAGGPRLTGTDKAVQACSAQR